MVADYATRSHKKERKKERKSVRKKRLYTKLRAKLAEEDRTQRDLAKLLRLTPQGINAKFQGRTDFSLREIIEICNYLNADPSVFFEPQLHNLQFGKAARS